MPRLLCAPLSLLQLKFLFTLRALMPCHIQSQNVYKANFYDYRQSTWTWPRATACTVGHCLAEGGSPLAKSGAAKSLTWGRTVGFGL